MANRVRWTAFLILCVSLRLGGPSAHAQLRKKTYFPKESTLIDCKQILNARNFSQYQKGEFCRYGDRAIEIEQLKEGSRNGLKNAGDWMKLKGKPLSEYESNRFQVITPKKMLNRSPGVSEQPGDVNSTASDVPAAPPASEPAKTEPASDSAKSETPKSETPKSDSKKPDTKKSDSADPKKKDPNQPKISVPKAKPSEDDDMTPDEARPDPKISVPAPTAKDDEDMTPPEVKDDRWKPGQVATVPPAGPSTQGKSPVVGDTKKLDPKTKTDPATTKKVDGKTKEKPQNQSPQQKKTKGKGAGNRSDQNTTPGEQTGSLVEVDEAAADPAKTCEDQALGAIYEFLLKDNQNVLSHLFEITSLRLAKRAAEHSKTTLEEKVKSDIEDLKAKMSELDTSEKAQEEILKIYEAYGMKADAQVIKKDLDATIAKGKDACYWCRNQRLENSHISAYILALSFEKDAALSEVDAATVWVVEKIRSQAAASDPRYRLGQEYGNLMNVSVRAARYLGRIAGGVALTAERIQKEIEERLEKIKSVIGLAKSKVQQSFESCVKAKHGDCKDCAAQDIKAFEETATLEFLQKGLLQAVSKEDNSKMIRGLKGKIGEVSFDLSDFAKGTIPRDTRRGKVDACGHPTGSHSKKK